MISEKQFSEQFPAFWHQCMPYLTPPAMVKINAGVSTIPTTNGCSSQPVRRHEDPKKNDLVAETGFEIFTAANQLGKSVHTLQEDKDLISKIAQNARERIAKLCRRGEECQIQPLSDIADPIEIALRLECFFRNQNTEKPTIQPRFKGCGILDSCYGDLLSGTKLYEVKSVGRNLRSTDIRQALTYCALNHHSHQYDIKEICILNPRQGYYKTFEVESLAKKLSGKNSAELFRQIGDFLINFETILRPSF